MPENLTSVLELLKHQRARVLRLSSRCVLVILEISWAADAQIQHGTFDVVKLEQREDKKRKQQRNRAVADFLGVPIDFHMPGNTCPNRQENCLIRLLLRLSELHRQTVTQKRAIVIRKRKALRNLEPG
jgi:hypothetical protein